MWREFRERTKIWVKDMEEADELDLVARTKEMRNIAEERHVVVGRKNYGNKEERGKRGRRSS